MAGTKRAPLQTSEAKEAPEKSAKRKSLAEKSEETSNQDEGMGEFEAEEEDEFESDAEMSGTLNSEEEEEEEVMDENDDESETGLETYLPGLALADGEVLDYDPATYDMLHSLDVEWPCLSFDFIKSAGTAASTAQKKQKLKYPLTVQMVAGTQADRPNRNKLHVLKSSRMHKTKYRETDDSDEDEDSSDDEDHLDEDPILETRSINHYGGVNRIRTMPHANPDIQICATWAETGKIHIWDIANAVKSLNEPGVTFDQNAQPIHTAHVHKTEGFAMDWSTTGSAGRLLTGDNDGKIYLTQRTEAGWRSDATPFTSHTSSVEDIQWSPHDQSIFISCSSDRSIKVWDLREHKKSRMSFLAHSADVNVISWNKNVQYLLASGGDEGAFKVWDMRNMKSATPASHFTWHKEPITSIEWHPMEDSLLAVTGADDQTTIWDLSVEQDESPSMTVKDVPSQLMFVHQGQQEVKEAHWHPQHAGVLATTASTGFNVLKTFNV